MKTLILAGLSLLSSLSFAGDITITKGVPSSQRNKIENDLNVIKNFQFKGIASQRTLEILEMDDLNTTTAYEWLTERINYIVEDQHIKNFSELLKKDKAFVEQEGVNYYYLLNNKNKVPEVAVDKLEKKTSVVVMSNLGTGLYMTGKYSSQLLGFNIRNGFFKDDTKIVIKSPRIGIIQIGEGLFSQTKTVNSRNPKALSNSIERLGTFFHEGRHSDGNTNGKSLGFTHSKCPTGHDLEGVGACDNNLNGPYSIGAVMLNEMTKSCDECSPLEKEILKISAIDSLGRVQAVSEQGVPSVDLDTTPESL